MTFHSDWSHLVVKLRVSALVRNMCCRAGLELQESGALTFQCPQHWTPWSSGRAGLESPDVGQLSVSYRQSDLRQDIQLACEME